jgi:hypothetical protein
MVEVIKVINSILKKKKIFFVRKNLEKRNTYKNI